MAEVVQVEFSFQQTFVDCLLHPFFAGLESNNSGFYSTCRLFWNLLKVNCQ